jgi:hypothetical protein
VDKAPAERRDAAHEELVYARAAWRCFRSVANQVRFILARDALTAVPASPDVRRRATDQVLDLLRDEIAIAREMYSLTKANSCIGFEAASQCVYTSLDLVQKAVQCRLQLDELRVPSGLTLSSVKLDWTPEAKVLIVHADDIGT